MRSSPFPLSLPLPLPPLPPSPLILILPSLDSRSRQTAARGPQQSTAKKRLLDWRKEKEVKGVWKERGRRKGGGRRKDTQWEWGGGGERGRVPRGAVQCSGVSGCCCHHRCCFVGSRRERREKGPLNRHWCDLRRAPLGQHISQVWRVRFIKRRKKVRTLPLSFTST